MLNAAWGLQVANVGRIFRRTLLIIVTLGLIAFALTAHSAPTESQAVSPSSTKTPLVALASSFRSVWPILMEVYVEELDNRPPLASFASSGLLSTQILRGAPFELFLSADQRSVTRIMEAGKTQKDPFAALFSGLRTAITIGDQNVLITCGYSFGDEHINSEIEHCLIDRANKTTVVAFTDERPEDDVIINKTLDRWLKHEKFGERVFVAGKNGLYNNSLTPSSPEDGKQFEWWMFSGLTKFLESGEV